MLYFAAKDISEYCPVLALPYAFKCQNQFKWLGAYADLVCKIKCFQQDQVRSQNNYAPILNHIR